MLDKKNKETPEFCILSQCQTEQLKDEYIRATNNVKMYFSLYEKDKQMWITDYALAIRELVAIRRVLTILQIHYKAYRPEFERWFMNEM